jgi:hypothetical protein
MKADVKFVGKKSEKVKKRAGKFVRECIQSWVVLSPRVGKTSHPRHVTFLLLSSEREDSNFSIPIIENSGNRPR